MPRPNFEPLHAKSAFTEPLAKRSELFHRRQKIEERLAEIGSMIRRETVSDPNLAAAEALLAGDDSTAGVGTLTDEKITLQRERDVINTAIEINDRTIADIERVERSAAYDEHVVPLHDKIRGRLAKTIETVLKAAKEEAELFDAAYDAGYRTGHSGDGRIMFSEHRETLESWLETAKA